MTGMTIAVPGTASRAGRAPRAADLAPRDWLEGGQALLKSGGLRALKLRRLAAALGASTGSFYHHFADFADYQAALADYFAGAQVEPLIDQLQASDLAPVARIRAFADHVRQHDMAQLALAMRAWARSDARAAAAIREHDAKVMAFLAAQLLAHGLDAQEAGIRAYALLAVGVGEVHPPEGIGRSALRDHLLTLLCRR